VAVQSPTGGAAHLTSLLQPEQRKGQAPVIHLKASAHEMVGTGSVFRAKG